MFNTYVGSRPCSIAKMKSTLQDIISYETSDTVPPLRNEKNYVSFVFIQLNLNLHAVQRGGIRKKWGNQIQHKGAVECLGRSVKKWMEGI